MSYNKVFNYIYTATNPSPSSHKINTVGLKKRDPFPINERDLIFSKIVIFSNKYKNSKIRKCYKNAFFLHYKPF